MPRKLITYEPTYCGLPINTTDNLGCDIRILERNLKMLNYMTNGYYRILAYSFTVKFPAEFICPEDEKLFRSFIREYAEALRKQGLGMEFIWVREKHSSSNHHYHVIAAIKSHDYRYPNRLTDEAARIWSQKLGIPLRLGLINRDASFLLERNAPDFLHNFQQCFYMLSYYTKERTKSGKPRDANSYGFSQLTHLG